MSKAEIIEILMHSKERFETEVLEFKEANGKFKIREIGQYFSALSNEANLKGRQNAYLIFGVANNGDICGTNFCQEATMPSKGLQGLKKQIADQTNNSITFKEIEELEFQGKRIIAFEIPPATRGIPTQWAKAAYAREGESLVPLPIDKIDEIRRQPPYDWSRQVIPGLTLEDLDRDAVLRAREKIRERYGDREGLIDGLDDQELFDKAGITFRGELTNAAVLLLGTEQAARSIIGALPKITWTLYESDGKERAHQHFDPPFLLTVGEVHRKIRNEEKRIMLDPDSLIPDRVMEYDAWSLRELICNAIAHQAYDRGGKVNVEEFPDRILFLNEGAFIPGDLETALSRGYKPPYYRNPFLVEAMLQVGMLDQNALGIRTVCEKAQDRCMPLPTYHLDDPGRVRVELFGVTLNERYSQTLRANPHLPLNVVLALDKLQKGISLSLNEREQLLDEGLVTEAPDGGLLFAVSSKGSCQTPAEMEGMEAPVEEHLRTAMERKHQASKRSYFTEAQRERLNAVLLQMLRDQGSLTRIELTEKVNSMVMDGSEPLLVETVDGNRVYRALKDLEVQKVVKGEGETRAKVWMLA